MSDSVKFLALLTISNIFMTIAWYGHLKHKQQALWVAIVTSWAIAFLEYCFQVPANRIGSRVMTVTQLKISQECITLTVFVVYAMIAFRETPKWNTLAAALCLVGAVYFTFRVRS
jgi:uncharacterized protein (DUF486 family)